MDINVSILCVDIELLFRYACHIGIISINNNKRDNYYIMFGEIHLEQISVSNLLFNLLILIALIVSVLYEVDVSGVNMFITDKDIGHTDYLQIHSVNIISKDLCQIYNVYICN